MNARTPISAAVIDRKISAMNAKVLAAANLPEARVTATRLFVDWLRLGQVLWVAEPRHFDASRIDLSILLKAIMDGSTREPIGGPDVVSRYAWSRNPFRAEVMQPPGLIRNLALEIREDPDETESTQIAVLSRDGSGATASKRILISLARTMLEPVLSHIRNREIKNCHHPGTLPAHHREACAIHPGKVRRGDPHRRRSDPPTRHWVIPPFASTRSSC